MRKVEVFAYDPAWPEVYAEEVKRIQSHLGREGMAFHHIGSTAVPGLAAKPTIDILLVVESHDLLDRREGKFVELGYEAKGENGIAGRRYYQKKAGEVHLFHIHAFEVDHSEINRHLDFRDYLRSHPDDARAYEALKLQLAAQFSYNPIEYTTGKTQLIQAIDQKATAWRLRISP
jgi:GrpB-like predicted nucleotidyltransferase (UPF0157 family)